MLMGLIMYNNKLQIKRASLKSSIGWLIEAGKILFKSPVNFMLVSLPFLFCFIIVLALNSYYYNNNYGIAIATFVMSLVFPFTISAISNAYRQYNHNNRIKLLDVYLAIFKSSNLRLILVYVLLVMFFSFASNYLFSIFEIVDNMVGYIVQLVFILFQFVILLAIPAGMYTGYQMKPFKMIFISLKAMMINIVSCVIFIIVVFIVLILAILIAKYLAILVGKFAIGIYLIELWIFVTWLCLGAVTMSKEIFDLDVN